MTIKTSKEVQAMTTEQILKEIGLLQNVQKAHATWHPEWQKASKRLNDRYNEMVRRERSRKARTSSTAFRDSWDDERQRSAAVSLGSRGGKAGTGKSKIRGDREYYRTISRLASKARKAKRAKK